MVQGIGNPVEALLEESCASGEIPGAAWVFGRRDGVAGVGACGFAIVNPERRRMTVDTVFDLASVTKCVATATGAMILIERGRMRLDDGVKEFVPEFGAAGKESVTIRHLLTHTSGLPAWADLYLHASSPADMIARICRMPLEYEPGSRVVYSCLGFIVLGEVVSRVAGQSLDAFVRAEVFAPLGMSDTCFNPPEGMRTRIAATEHCKWRGRVLIGEVHDENAFAMGGVSGNAGLFSTVRDLAVFCRMFLGEGSLGGVRVLSPAAVRAMTRDYTGHRLGESRGLGWVVRGEGALSSAGDLMSARAYGHTGFTGTSVWIDPELDVFAVLLTNRVHFGRSCEAHIKLRPRFHNAVVGLLC
ncbi:MAG: beta-lactamase family protein [Firmicutes bacterium]|jgi:CubicO group peptidase (beta-lactamase class C family)|nr:beta-lactamase family protein [Bacillota bacterium]MDH7496356.1 serine hydrolase domain-containing protein [Bacillota bacterium]